MKNLHLLAFLFCSTILVSQDIHWSQPAGPLLYTNPAFSGTGGKFSIAAGYRDQWNAVTSNYKTGLVAGDYRFGNEKQPLAFNAGVLFYNDVTGGGAFRTNCFGITASSLLKTGKRSFAGVGLAYQRLRSTVFADNFSWGSQYNGSTYDPTLPSGELSKMLQTEYANLQAGMAYFFEEQANAATNAPNRNVLIGYSADHLTRPLYSLAGSDDRLLMKHALYFQAYLPAGPDRALKPLLLAQLQGPHYMVLAGALWRHAIGPVSRFTGIRKGSGFAFGVMYRVADAIIPAVEFEKENVLIGFSYDINISKLTPASRLRGGAEISIRIRPSSAPATIQTKPPTTRSMYDLRP